MLLLMTSLLYEDNQGIKLSICSCILCTLFIHKTNVGATDYLHGALEDIIQ
jgi:hypothetical protein